MESGAKRRKKSFSDRHKGECNIVFTDGHTEFIKESGIDNLKWTVEEKTE